MEQFGTQMLTIFGKIYTPLWFRILRMHADLGRILGPEVEVRSGKMDFSGLTDGRQRLRVFGFAGFYRKRPLFGRK